MIGGSNVFAVFELWLGEMIPIQKIVVFSRLVETQKGSQQVLMRNGHVHDMERKEILRHGQWNLGQLEFYTDLAHGEAALWNAA